MVDQHLTKLEVAESFLLETEVSDDPVGDVIVALMVEFVREKAGRPALRWLRAKAYERLGRVEWPRTSCWRPSGSTRAGR